MKSFEVDQWLRPNIKSLKPYSSARDEFSGEALVFLDANENCFDNGLNRYPDPKSSDLRARVSALLGIKSGNIFFGNGSDEAIDLIIRASCDSGKDAILAISPSYGMYEVCAAIQGVRIDKVLLEEDFSLSSAKLLKAVKQNHKIVFLCSPNNPTGNILEKEEVENVLQNFSGVVVVDEAYIDFSDSPGLVDLIDRYPNLILLRTFSKAWGLAGVRCGMAISNEEIVNVLMKIKYPYNLNTLTQNRVAEALDQAKILSVQLDSIIREREILIKSLRDIPTILNVYDSQANFVLIRVDDPDNVYQRLLDKGLVVRNRNKQDLCSGCLRITIGTVEENRRFIESLKEILS